jgi:uncharacterized small protein (DUF1192 family)
LKQQLASLKELSEQVAEIQRLKAELLEQLNTMKVNK